MQIRRLEDVLSERCGEEVDPHRQSEQDRRDREQDAREEQREREKRGYR